MKQFLTTLLLALCANSLLLAQGIMQDSLNIEQWTRLNQENSNQLEIIWDQDSGRFSKMLGHTQSYGRTPDQAINTFLTQEKKLLGIRADNDLRRTNSFSGRNGQMRYRFTQIYKNIPVLDSGYLISVSKDGNINYISGDYYQNIMVDTIPLIQSDNVIPIIKRDLNKLHLTEAEKPSLVILPTSKNTKKPKFKLIWQTKIVEKNGAWQYHIDAINGNIIEKNSLINTISFTKFDSELMTIEKIESNYSGISWPNASGNVYQVSPNYGSVTSQTIHRLDNLSPRKLKGENVTVDYYNNTNASSSTGTFNYSTTSPHFDEVMAYYHSDEFETWLIQKGLNNSLVGKVSITTRHPSYYAAAYSPGREIYYGSSMLGLNNPTKEATVIAHEYMHVVSEYFHDLEALGHEKAMDEAYSDYFAIAYRDDFGGVLSSIIGEYVDQAGGLNYKRNLDNSYTMDHYYTIDLEPNGITQQHDRSVIFSGALWILRNDADVNDDVVDELILESLGNLDNNTDFLDGMYALIATAKNSGYSSYEDDIRDAFIAKKIYTPPPLTVNIFGPSALYPSQTGLWLASATYGATPYSYQWQKRNSGSLWWYNVGTNSTYSTSSNVDFDLKLIVTDNNNDKATKIISVNHDGGPIPKVIGQVSDAIPEVFMLAQNYPNPFNPSTIIRFEIPVQAQVSLIVFNVMGQKVSTLIDHRLNAGFHTYTFDASSLPSGVYIARMEAIGLSGEIFTKSMKMQLIK